MYLRTFRFVSNWQHFISFLLGARRTHVRRILSFSPFLAVVFLRKIFVRTAKTRRVLFLRKFAHRTTTRTIFVVTFVGATRKGVDVAWRWFTNLEMCNGDGERDSRSDSIQIRKKIRDIFRFSPRRAFARRRRRRGRARDALFTESSRGTS